MWYLIVSIPDLCTLTYFKRMLHRLDLVYTCQNATLLEITYHGSYMELILMNLARMSDSVYHVTASRGKTSNMERADCFHLVVLLVSCDSFNSLSIKHYIRKPGTKVYAHLN